MNFTLFVLTVAASHQSASRLNRLKASVGALPCSGSVTIKVFPVRAGHTLGSKLQIMESAQNFHHKNGGIVGIAEDDISFHPNFCVELDKTVNQLPRTWGVLHLCPGFAWGRKFPDHEHRPVTFRPERNFRSGPSPRFWNGPPARNAWLGGPEAYLVKSVKFWPLIMRHMRSGKGITDIDLTLNALRHPGMDFVARDPPLCKEVDGGYSVRKRG